MKKFSKIINVAEAKRRFSEIVNQVVYHGRRFVIGRRGRPMVGLIPAEEMEEETPHAPRQGFLTLVGLWKDVEGIDSLVEEIYRQRELEIRRSLPDLNS